MVRILHAADLHLDSPFSSLSPEEAAARRRQQRQLPQILSRLCEENHCDMLLLAGDIFDGENICPETIEALQKALQGCRVPVFIAPGNHDPLTPTSPWKQYSWPEHVHIFPGEMSVVTLPEQHCRVWGAALCSAVDSGQMRNITPQGDWLEIGVFHGDPAASGNFQSAAEQLAASSGLDYLAMGHIHKTALPQKAGSTWFGWPGVTMGRGFDETGQRGVFLVELSKQTCRTQWLPIPAVRYEIIRCPAQEISIAPEQEGTICRLVLTGEAEHLERQDIWEQLHQRFLSLEVVDHTTPPQSLWDSCGENTLRGLALQSLKLNWQQADEDEKQLVMQAARAVLAALEGRDLPW